MSESASVTVTRSVTTAAGVYASGHFGQLTQYLPFELVDDVLAQTKTTRRLRSLPSRVGVSFVLTPMLSPGLGMGGCGGRVEEGRMLTSLDRAAGGREPAGPRLVP